MRTHVLITHPGLVLGEKSRHCSLYTYTYKETYEHMHVIHLQTIPRIPSWESVRVRTLELSLNLIPWKGREESEHQSRNVIPEEADSWNYMYIRKGLVGTECDEEEYNVTFDSLPHYAKS
jgi:hypothetical protein